MVLRIDVNNLASRVARTQSTGGSGIRRLAINGTVDNSSENLLSVVYNAIERFGQSLMRATLGRIGDFLRFSWTKFWNTLVTAKQFLVNFDINSTDAALDEQIKSAEIALAGVRGALDGQRLGFLVCGIIPAASLVVFNEPLALVVLKEIGEEAAEEIAASTAVLINLTIQKEVKKTFYAFFKNHRTLVRNAYLGFANFLVERGILTQDSVLTAKTQRNQPWTLANALEVSNESIKDPIERAYRENFYEELDEACIEAGYIVAGSIDGFLAQQRLAGDQILGEERTVEILLDRSASIAPAT